MSILKRSFRVVAIVLATCGLLLGTLWAVGALWFDLPFTSGRAAIAVSFGAIAFVLLSIRPGSWLPKAVVAIAIVLVALWWHSLQPRQDRDWKPEVAIAPNALRDANEVTIQDVRDFEYRSEIDFTPRYRTNTYDLERLRGLDLFVTYWGSPLIAHPIMSFDFGEQGRVCFSIETRSERGEPYSAIRGLYRQFELIYIAAEERDVIRLRTSFRQGEDVYLYHLNFPLNDVRALFLEYARRIGELHAEPEWYNAITTNCTTSIRAQRPAGDRSPWDWRILANGKADEMLYERGVLDRTFPFAELKRRAHINERAKATADLPDFSERIRVAPPQT